jgi:ADP-heptose:LPS heptosyltransferase
MVEWIRLSDLMISNDSGPMHVAAALGKALVAVFGPTEPRRTGPYHQPRGVVQASLSCIPCMKSRCANPEQLACVRRIAPDAIRALALERLEETLPLRQASFCGLPVR